MVLCGWLLLAVACLTQFGSPYALGRCGQAAPGLEGGQGVRQTDGHVEGNSLDAPLARVVPTRRAGSRFTFSVFLAFNASLGLREAAGSTWGI